MPARLAAVLVAIAMVAVSLVVRDRLDDGDGDDSAGGRSGVLVLGCITELADICRQLEDVDDVSVRVEDAATLAGTDEDFDIDGWITMAPLAELIDGARERAGRRRAFAPATVIARSPLVMSVWPDRSAVLAPRCGGELRSWRCVGEAASEPSWAAIGGEVSWGPVKIGMPDPATSALGLLTLSQATVDWFGRDDVSRFDLETEEAYRRWLAALEAAVRSRSGGELEHMLLAPGALDVAATTEAAAVSLLARLAAGRSRPDVIYPAPMATADVVLATTAGDRGARLARTLADRLADALAAAGWRVAGRTSTVAPSEPPLPDANGLPAADVMEAIREVWVEVAR
jgi:hypothetical protein